MKRGTPRHPKTFHLAELLGIPLPHAAGILELLWHFAGEFAKRGDVGRFSNTRIAEAVCWPADRADEVVHALAESHWLDRCQVNRLLVHDWAEHAEESVKKYLARNGLEFAVLVPMEESVATRPDLVETRPDKVAPCPTPEANHVAPRAGPQPLPLPKPQPSPPAPQGEEGDGIPLPAGLNSEAFKTAWSEYRVYRRERRLPVLKPISVKKQLDRLALWGEDRAIAAINHSIANGWQGILEPRDLPPIPVNGQRRGPPENGHLAAHQRAPRAELPPITEEQIRAGLAKTYDEHGRFRTPPRGRNEP